MAKKRVKNQHFSQFIWIKVEKPLYLHTDLGDQVVNGGCSSAG